MWEQVNKRARIQHATALFFFEPQSIVQSSIHALKYKGQETLGAYFGQLLGHCLKATVFCQCTAIVPVPLHPKRKKQRGYNQVMRFAESLSEALGVPVKTMVIKRIKHTSSLALGSYKKPMGIHGYSFWAPSTNRCNTTALVVGGRRPHHRGHNYFLCQGTAFLSLFKSEYCYHCI